MQPGKHMHIYVIYTSYIRHIIHDSFMIHTPTGNYRCEASPIQRYPPPYSPGSGAAAEAVVEVAVFVVEVVAVVAVVVVVVVVVSVAVISR